MSDNRYCVMAGFGRSGILLIDGAVGHFRQGFIPHPQLGLPQDLSNRFHAWTDKYWDIKEPSFDLRDFYLEGKALAVDLKRFLGEDIDVEYQPARADGTYEDALEIFL